MAHRESRILLWNSALLLSELCDLKPLAFQAKTSSTWNPFVVGRESGNRGDLKKPGEPSRLRPVFLQSGLQPTIEPTGFQTVVVQLSYTRNQQCSAACRSEVTPKCGGFGLRI
jgi:hypothetical protein